MADKKGTALMMVWVDVPADKEEEFNRWYNEEHLAEYRAAVPGVLSAARYQAVRSGPKYLACYELESPAVVESDAFTGYTPTAWGKRIGPRVIGTTWFRNVYEMIRPARLTRAIANSGMAPVLQIGRMDIPPEHETEWNRWYNTVFAANFEKVPGCIRARRFRAVRGEPKYAVVYELEHEKVPESSAWLAQRDIDPSSPRMRSLMRHAPRSPGVWKKTFPL